MVAGALGTDPKSLTYSRESPGLYRGSDGNTYQKNGNNYTLYRKSGSSQVVNNGPTNQGPSAPPSLNDVSGDVNSAAANYAGAASSAQAPTATPQAAFNPGDYSSFLTQGYNSAMSNFDATNNQVFAKQDADFKQMAAEKGWDPTSAAYAQAYNLDVLQPQQQARQQSESAGYTQGLGAAQQAYGQANTTYGTNLAANNQNFTQGVTAYGAPASNLSNLAGYNTNQTNIATTNLTNTNKTQLQQMLDQTNTTIAQIQAAASKYGKLTADQNLQLQQMQALTPILSSYLGGSNAPALPTLSSGLSQGVAAGVGAAVGSGLKGGN